MNEVTRDRLKDAKRIVVKVGSAQLTTPEGGLSSVAIARLAVQLGELHQAGKEVLVVSSGAVASGMAKLGISVRPTDMSEVQALAAVGQMGLVQAWERMCQDNGFQTAQVLLTHDDLSDRKRYLNARMTLKTLLRFNVVPVINENDTVVTDEICFGDNDSLGALVANLVEADALIILTDQKGLYDRDPRTNPDAKLVNVASALDDSLGGMATGDTGSLGRGGMATKVRAARIACRSGTHTVIAHGETPGVVLSVLRGDAVGTFLYADQTPQAARKQWLSAHLQMRGSLTVDEGAERVLREQGKSLLPVGVVAVEGAFARGEMVQVVNSEGRAIVRGLVNYNAEEANALIGVATKDIEAQLGYAREPELIHRDNMVSE